MRIRNAGSPSDWEAIREICCETGRAGEPIEASRREFFAELWIAPYQERCARWAYVAEDETGAPGGKPRIAGYLTGCADTVGLRRNRWLGMTVPLLIQIALGRYEWNSDVKRFLKRTFGLERSPESLFDGRFLDRLERDYPAHLHVNLRKPYRSSGLGAKLVDQFCADLVDGGVGGVHLFCGQGPLKFYLKNGFEKLASIDFRGIPVHALGRKLARAPGG